MIHTRTRGTYYFLYAVFEVFVENFGRHLKNDLDVLACLGRGFQKERDAVVSLKIPRFLHCNLAMLFLVLLIPYQNHNYFGVTILSHFFKPRL